MKTFIFPGSFDPFSLGHLDVARRAANLCDRLLVAVMQNRSKNYLFTIDERVEMATRCLNMFPSIEVISYDRLLVDLFKEEGASAVVRGLRSESDSRIEAEMAAANRLLYKEFDAIMLPCRTDLAYTSSSIIKEVAFYGGDISGMVSPVISDYVTAKILERTKRV